MTSLVACCWYVLMFYVPLQTACYWYVLMFYVPLQTVCCWHVLICPITNRLLLACADVLCPIANCLLLVCADFLCPIANHLLLVCTKVYVLPKNCFRCWYVLMCVLNRRLLLLPSDVCAVWIMRCVHLLFCVAVLFGLSYIVVAGACQNNVLRPVEEYFVAVCGILIGGVGQIMCYALLKGTLLLCVVYLSAVWVK